MKDITKYQKRPKFKTVGVGYGTRDVNGNACLLRSLSTGSEKKRRTD